MAQLKAKYTSEDEIPDVSVKEFFEERQGNWLITIDGVKSEADVHKLQTATAKLREEKDGLKKKLEAYTKTPDEIDDLIHELDELKTASALKDNKPNSEELEKAVEAGIKSKTAILQREIDKLTGEVSGLKSENETLTGEIKTSKISRIFTESAVEAGVLEEAIADQVRLYSPVFDVQLGEDGKEFLVTKEGVGVIPGMTPKDFWEDLQPKRSYIFKGSNGAGANGNRNGGAGFSKNPWSADHWNMTEQMRIQNTDGRDKAEQMAKAAGSAVGAALPPEKK